MVKMPHWPKPIGLLQNETSLSRMQEILGRLDNPHHKLPLVVHVAGTNGKGSTVAFMRAIMECAGYKVHAYTTPHLVDFNERIYLSGKNISDDFLFEVLEEVRLNSEDIRLGFYEATTAAAFLAFSRVEADILLLETGLGGRLDATNIIEAPALAIITTIARDHVEFLGYDLRDIALQKLGIVKPGTICISSLQYENVAEVITDYCGVRDIPLITFGEDFGIEKIASPTHPALDAGPHLGIPHQVRDVRGRFNYFSEKLEIELPMPSLAGDHQLVNAATAITALLHLENFKITADNIKTGLQNTHWPSRLEKIERDYIPKNWEFYIDGAHNPAGAFAIASHLDYWQDKPVYLIFGTTKGREVKDFLVKFAGKIQLLCLVKIQSEPASYEPEEMLARTEGFKTTTHDNLQEAIKYITTTHPPGRILTLGSLFMRGDI